jgi:hypothetical protein
MARKVSTKPISINWSIGMGKGGWRIRLNFESAAKPTRPERLIGKIAGKSNFNCFEPKKSARVKI